MNEELRSTLLGLVAEDQRVRQALLTGGVLFDGYHPQMEAVHRANAAALRTLIARHGWPDVSIAGQDGCEAAWLIAQHAIGEPDFMRTCRALIEVAAQAGNAPRWQFAYIDDRIRSYEGRPQRYGTQMDLTPTGPQPLALEEPDAVDARRSEVGLASLAEALGRAASDALPSLEEYDLRQAQGRAWARRVGWQA